MLAAFLSGTTLPLQSAVNSTVSGHLGNPLYGTMISFTGGAVLSLLVCLLTPVGFPPLSKFAGINWIYFSGGIYGMIIVTSVILSVPFAGVSATLASVIAGQLIMSVVFDHFGWLGLAEMKITVSRLAGIALLLAGVYLIQK